MPLTGMALMAGGSLVSGLFSSSAGSQMAQSISQAAADQMTMYNNNVGLSAPYRQAGTGATNMLGNYLGVNGSQAQSQAMQNYQTSPFFQQMQQNTIGQTMNAFAGQGQMGGNAVAGLGQQLAAQNYGQFNTQMGQLAGLGQQGAGVTNALMGQGTQAAQNQGQLLMQAAQAQGAGTMGLGNALGTGLNSAGIFSLLGSGGNNSLSSQLGSWLAGSIGGMPANSFAP